MAGPTPPVAFSPNPQNSAVTQPAVPQGVAPPWFQAAVQQLRQQLLADIRLDIQAEIMPDLKRVMNHSRGDGTVAHFEIVPFANGTDPTKPPNNLPPLYSANIIDNLAGHQVVAYLNGYNVIPLPAGANPLDTNWLRKEKLKQLVGMSVG